jgi:hypothetical protein
MSTQRPVCIRPAVTWPTPEIRVTAGPASCQAASPDSSAEHDTCHIGQALRTSGAGAISRSCS